MDPNSVQLIVGKLELLAEKVGCTGTQLYTILVKEAWWCGLAHLLACICVYCIVNVILYFLYRGLCVCEKPEDPKEVVPVLVIVSAIILVVITLIASGISNGLWQPNTVVINNILR